MKLPRLRIGASSDDTEEALLYGLIAISKNAFSQHLLIQQLTGRKPPYSEKQIEQWADQAFSSVLSMLPEGNPFRKPLELALADFKSSGSKAEASPQDSRPVADRPS